MHVYLNTHTNVAYVGNTYSAISRDLNISVRRLKYLEKTKRTIKGLQWCQVIECKLHGKNKNFERYA